MVATNFRGKFARYGGLAALGMALGAAVFTIPASAFQREGVLDLATVETCLMLADDRAAVAEALQRLRWQPVAAIDLDEQARQALALYFVSQHVFDAAPDMRLLSAWQRALDNVKGITRLAPTPAAPLYFTSPGGSLLKMNFQQDQWITGLYCTMILSPEDMAQTLEGIAASLGGPLSDLPVFKTMPEDARVDTQARRSFRLTLIDRAELAEKIGLEPHFAAIVETALEAKPPGE